MVKVTQTEEQQFTELRFRVEKHYLWQEYDGTRHKPIERGL